MTGHEHQHEAFTKTSASVNLEYVAGRAMFDARASENGFNLITIDLEARQLTTVSLIWDGTQYRSTGSAAKSTFLRNRALLEQGFQNNQAFLNHLSDIGTGFTHERKHLRLSDVFVYPNLLHRVYQRNLDGKVISPRRIRHKDAASFLLSEPRLLILGANRSGKSALARTIYRAFQTEKQLVPILIKGSDLTADCQLATVLDSAYKNQYSPVSLERFKQLSKERTCIIIDDLHKAKVGLKAQTKLVARLEQMFGTLIFFAHDLFDVDRILAGNQHPLFYDYRQYSIEEFNRVQRGALIEKWIGLGRSDWEQESPLQAEVEAKEKVINTLLWRQLVPAHPIVITAFLQAMESMRTPNTASGSYGELYESLITDRLALVSKKATDISIKYALISRIAYMMYERDTTSLTKDDIEEVCDQYFGEYQIRRSAASLIADLLEAGIIKEAAGNYQFVYPYYFHFFVARYFRDKVDDSIAGPNLRDRLSHMADRVYFEDYSNIIVFYLYLKKDTAVIEHILSNASKIYNSHAPCTLEDKVVDDLNKLALSAPRCRITL